MRDELKTLFELIDDYIGQIDSPREVVHYKNIEELTRIIKPETKPRGETLDTIFEHIKNYLDFSVHTANPMYMNQLFSGFNLPAFMGDVVTSLTNTSMYTYEVAPVATVIEMELIRKMAGLVGFSGGEGTFLTGGSNANLIAMFSARNQKAPSVKRAGVYGNKPLTAFVSEQSHYSFATAANLLGLGTRNLISVPSDPSGRMIPSELDRLITRSSENSGEPFFVGATAGTTLLGAFDPIDEIAGVCRRHNLWLHVDGAFGGSAILSEKHRHLLSGIEKADSFTWDPHKLMNIPLICSVILMKQKGILHNNLVDRNTDYLFHESETESYDLGQKSIQCGRRVDVLKLWLAWKFHGDEGYRKRTDALFKAASYMEKKVENAAQLELLTPVQSFAVCFRYIPPAGVDGNSLNRQIRDNLRKAGKCIINYGFIGDTLAIRFVATNPDLKPADMDSVIDHILGEGDRLTAKNNKSAAFG